MEPTPFLRRIGTRILAALLCVAMASISVSLVLLSIQAGKFMRETISQRNLQIARQASGEIGRYVGISLGELESLGKLLTPLPYSPWILSTLLANTSVEFRKFGWVCLVGPDGSPVADSSLLGTKEKRTLEKEALSTALGGHPFTSDVRVSDFFVPFMIVGVPARLPDGRSGALVAELSLRDIWGLVDQLSVGKRGLTYLVSSTGVLISHPDKVKVLSQYRDKGIALPPATLDSAGTVRVEDIPGRGRFLTAYSRVIGENWIVAVQQPLDEAFLPAAMLFRQSLIQVALGVGLSIALSVIFSRNISIPLVSLMRGTQILASGTMDHKIPIHTRDEIGQLAESFNVMVEKLRERTHELEESERKHRLVTERVNDLIFSLDGEGRIVFMSPQIAQIAGYAPSEALGRRFSELLAEESSRKRWDAFLERLAGTDRSLPELQVTLETNTGRPVILEVNASREKEPDGQYVFYGVARDISERTRLEEQLIQSQRMEAVGRLAGGVAHDFNNLLTAIIGYCDLSLSQLEGENPLRENVEEIKRAGNRAAALTKQLLAFSRKQILQPRILDLNKTIATLSGLLERLIGEHIALKTRLDPELGRISADPSQIEQVIMNLCLNSRDAMPGGGEIVLSTRNSVVEPGGQDRAAIPAGSYVTLVVSDTGIGMSKEVQAHVFEPFYTTKELGKGTGLGLSTVFGIVKQSGGHIRFQSTTGNGTTFEVLFPREDGQETETPVAAVSREPRGTETILLVEDERMIQGLVTETLEKSGYTVLVAGSAEEALGIIGTSGQKIHLAVTDIVLPGMNGRAFGEYVTSRSPEIAILYISGYASDTIIGNEKPFSDASFLQKPFTPSSLLAKVREVLDGNAQRG